MTRGEKKEVRSVRMEGGAGSRHHRGGSSQSSIHVQIPRTHSEAKKEGRGKRGNRKRSNNAEQCQVLASRDNTKTKDLAELADLGRSWAGPAGPTLQQIREKQREANERRARGVSLGESVALLERRGPGCCSAICRSLEARRGLLLWLRSGERKAQTGPVAITPSWHCVLEKTGLK